MIKNNDAVSLPPSSYGRIVLRAETQAPQIAPVSQSAVDLLLRDKDIYGNRARRKGVCRPCAWADSSDVSSRLRIRRDYCECGAPQRVPVHFTESHFDPHIRALARARARFVDWESDAAPRLRVRDGTRGGEPRTRAVRSGYLGTSPSWRSLAFKKARYSAVKRQEEEKEEEAEIYRRENAGARESR